MTCIQDLAKLIEIVNFKALEENVKISSTRVNSKTIYSMAGVGTSMNVEFIGETGIKEWDMAEENSLQTMDRFKKVTGIWVYLNDKD